MLQNLLNICLIVLLSAVPVFAQAGVTPVKPATGANFAQESGGNLAGTASGVGATSDAAATAGGVGSVNAKLRLLTDLVNQILTELSQKTEPANTQIVGDGSGPLTVDGTVAATQSGNWSVRNQDGSGNNLTSATRGSERALSVQIVDGSGSQVTSFGGSGGTASNFGSAFPTPGTAAGFTDGTNMVSGKVMTTTPASNDPGLVVRSISPASSTTGSAVPSAGVQVTGTDGTNARALKTDTSGELQIDVLTLPALPAGANTIGNVGALPVTSGGTSVCYVSSAASTNSTNCKASAGQIYGYDLVNTTTTIYYLRIYNSSSAPTCSSATGFVRTIPVPPAAAAGGAGGVARSLAVGEAYGTGIGFCLTGGGSSTDNTNAGTGVYVAINYK